MSLHGQEIPSDLVDQLHAGGATVLHRASLSQFTTFKLGGICPALIDCPDAGAFKTAWSGLAEHGIAKRLIGGGSNLLIHDEGISEVVVRYVEVESAFDRDGTLVNVSAGTNLDAFARKTAETGLDGVVYCSGIPGTVGGAIAGNAGAFGEQIGDRIESVEVMNSRGMVRTLQHDELGFAYRRSSLQESGDVILSAAIHFDERPPEELLSRRAEILGLRVAKHPDWNKTPTAGSFFKNVEPTSKAGRRQAAGWFLQEAGVMSMRVGGARLFERHANIIIAEEGCKAFDVLALSMMMAEAVKEKFDLTLNREVKLIGFDS